MEEYYLYILRRSDGTFYIGITDDLKVRLEEHRQGKHPNAYTYGRRPVELVWAEGFELRTDAFELERQLKGWSHAKKEAFIRGDWNAVQLLSRNRSTRPLPGD